jgi:hypothetical protein
MVFALSHERDAAAEALRKKRSRAVVGGVEQVLHADGIGPCCGVRELFEAVIAEASPAMRPASRAATIAASWSSKRAPARPSPGRRR